VSRPTYSSRSRRHRKWLWNRQFAHPAQQIAFQAHLNALDHDEARKKELEQQVGELLAESPWAKQMRALQATNAL
jgi:transposase